MRNSVLDIKQFTPRAEVLEALEKETSKGHPPNNHRLYHETVKCEIKFKEAVKAPPINIEMLTKENRNDNKT